jgi:AraC-like DNA-binding protein
LPHREIIIDTSTVAAQSMQRQIQTSLTGIVRADVDIEDAKQIQARWRVSQCGNCTMMRIVVDGDSSSGIRRTAEHLAQEPDLYCQIFRIRSGAVEITQNDRNVVLRENQFAMLASHTPFETRRAQGFADIHSVRIPLSLLSNRVQHPEDFAFRPQAIREGIEAITFDYMDTLIERMQDAPASLWPALTNQLADLMSLTLMGMKEALPTGESAVRLATVDRIKAFIGERLSQFDLNPAAIAAANGLSTRYLHRLFQMSGQSVGDYIRSQRLAAARRALENPVHAGSPIADIGHSFGFRSAAHFSTAYSSEFGESPRETRARKSDG